jgi:hypothetical protein
MKTKFLITLCIGLAFWELRTVYAAADTLNTAIEKQADYIVEKSPRDAVMAIVDIKSGGKALSQYVMEKLPDHVVNSKKNITFVDRSKRDLIQQELNFQHSGEVSDDEMVSMGKKLGARVIVTGIIMEVGTIYSFSVKLLDVESAKIIGSNSTPIEHDTTMEGFLSDSRVARLAEKEAQEERSKYESMISTIKNVLGIFSEGLYLGYIGSSRLPLGLSFGGINTSAALFIETGFGPPAYQGYERDADVSYTGNIIKNPRPGFTYMNENQKTSFIWDLDAGLNINIIETFLWTNIGAGFEYERDYKLFKESSAGGSNMVWIQNKSSDWKLTLSAGLLVKIWYLYFQGKYKYMVGEELDTSGYGLKHLSFGVGYVWRSE